MDITSFPTETVQPGYSDYTEGKTESSKTINSHAKRSFRDIAEAVGVGGAPANYAARPEFNDLAALAYQLSEQEYAALSEDEQKTISPSTMAIAKFNELVAERQRNSQSGSVLTKQSNRVTGTQEIKSNTMTKIIRKTAPEQIAANTAIPYDLGLPGLSSVPNAPDVTCQLKYFLANGTMDNMMFDVDWVLEQRVGDTVAVVLVIDGRRPGAEKSVPKIPPMPDTRNTLKIRCGEDSAEYGIEQGCLRLDIGDLIVLVMG